MNQQGNILMQRTFFYQSQLRRNDTDSFLKRLITGDKNNIQKETLSKTDGVGIATTIYVKVRYYNGEARKCFAFRGIWN